MQVIYLNETTNAVQVEDQVLPFSCSILKFTINLHGQMEYICSVLTV